MYFGNFSRDPFTHLQSCRTGYADPLFSAACGPPHGACKIRNIEQALFFLLPSKNHFFCQILLTNETGMKLMELILCGFFGIPWANKAVFLPLTCKKMETAH